MKALLFCAAVFCSTLAVVLLFTSGGDALLFLLLSALLLPSESRGVAAAFDRAELALRRTIGSLRELDLKRGPSQDREEFDTGLPHAAADARARKPTAEDREDFDAWPRTAADARTMKPTAVDREEFDAEPPHAAADAASIANAPTEPLPEQIPQPRPAAAAPGDASVQEVPVVLQKPSRAPRIAGTMQMWTPARPLTQPAEPQASPPSADGKRTIVMFPPPAEATSSKSRERAARDQRATTIPEAPRRVGNR